MSAQIAPSRLHEVELLRDFTTEELEQLLAVCEDVSFHEGDVIIEAGQEHRALYILLEGMVQIDLEVPRLGQRVVADLAPSSVFGESSFFHPGPHSATVKCLARSRLLRLDRSQYDVLCATSHVAALKLGANAAVILATRLQQTDHWIVDVLAEWQEAKIHDSYRRFRERMGNAFSFGSSSTFTPGGM